MGEFVSIKNEFRMTEAMIKWTKFSSGGKYKKIINNVIYYTPFVPHA